MVCPGTACSTTAAQAPRSARRSGDWCASIGVGTQTMIASASASMVGSVVSFSTSDAGGRSAAGGRGRQVDLAALDVGQPVLGQVVAR